VDACVDDAGVCHERRSCDASNGACVSACANPGATTTSTPSTVACVALVIASVWLLLANLWLVMVVVSVTRSCKGRPPDREGCRGASAASREDHDGGNASAS
jgi:hypothetical protein